MNERSGYDWKDPDLFWVDNDEYNHTITKENIQKQIYSKRIIL